MKFYYPIGATPLNHDDAASLIPKHINEQSQLNEWKYKNIIKGQQWLFASKHKDLITLEFLKKLHHKMFNETWGWAGQFRRYQTNIGVEPPQIAVQLKNLCDDVIFWIHAGSFSKEESAVRFHHRLVQIHAFPNGNGRHARLMADALLINQGCPKFSWGSTSLGIDSATRKKYIKALQSADTGDYNPLKAFVRQ